MTTNIALIDKAKDFIWFSKNLKPQQVECLLSALEGRDVMAILPSGFGKSVIYQLVPFVIGLKRGTALENIDICVLVITPLNSIMIDQCHSLCKMGVKACTLDYNCLQAETFINETNESDSDTDENDNENISTTVNLADIMKGQYQVVYAHPEALLQTSRGERLLTNLSNSNRLACVAIDEAHIILEWQVVFDQIVVLL